MTYAGEGNSTPSKVWQLPRKGVKNELRASVVPAKFHQLIFSFDAQTVLFLCLFFFFDSCCRIHLLCHPIAPFFLIRWACCPLRCAVTWQFQRGARRSRQPWSHRQSKRNFERNETARFVMAAARCSVFVFERVHCIPSPASSMDGVADMVGEWLSHSGVKTCRVAETRAEQLPQVMSPKNLRLSRGSKLILEIHINNMMYRKNLEKKITELLSPKKWRNLEN